MVYTALLAYCATYHNFVTFGLLKRFTVSDQHGDYEFMTDTHEETVGCDGFTEPQLLEPSWNIQKRKFNRDMLRGID